MKSLIMSLLKDPLRIFRGIGYRVLDLFARRLSDETYLKCKWFIRTGHALDLNNPKTFNEKLQWLKLYDRKPIYTTMVDKYEAKKYVANIIGEEHIIPTLAVYDSVEDIDFDALPDQFVLKCTHDSGGVVICSDKSKLDRKKAIEKLRKGLNSNFFWTNREWPYKNVKPRIIAEQYMEDENTKELRDYKFFCFDGVVKLFKIDFDRFTEHHANYYTPTGQLQPFGEAMVPPKPDKVLEMPVTIGQMVEMAEKLAGDKCFVRIDFYDHKEQVYFGEITFFPASGMGKFIPSEWDNTLGRWLTLPIEGGVLISNKFTKYLYAKPELNDYKIYCFDGKPKVIMVASGRFSGQKTFAYLDAEWNKLDFMWGAPKPKEYPSKPKNFVKMLEIAAKLSVGIPQLRVDLYNIKGHIYFGELTFFDGSGMQFFNPYEWDYKIGAFIKLPTKSLL